MKPNKNIDEQTKKAIEKFLTHGKPVAGESKFLKLLKSIQFVNKNKH